MIDLFKMLKNLYNCDVNIEVQKQRLGLYFCLRFIIYFLIICRNASLDLHRNVYSARVLAETNWLKEHYDPLLISEAAFSVATVLSFLSLLRDIVVLAFVGPLRVSLGGMISDILRFVFLFAFVWVSFGIGMTHLYQTYDVMSGIRCDKDPSQDCEANMFGE